MRSVLPVLIFTAACCTYEAANPVGLAPEDIPRVVFLAGETAPRSGTGVVIAKGWVLTAKHVLPLARDWPTFAHPTRDLALVKIDGLEGSARFAAPPAFGTPVYALGWHNGSAERLTVGLQGRTPGTMSAPIFPGASGGPVMNKDGCVIGVVARVMYSHIGQPEPEFYIVSFCSWYVPVDTDWIAYVLAQNS